MCFFITFCQERTMGSKIDKVSIISCLVILFLIAMTGLYAYHVADTKDNTFSQDTVQRSVYPEFQEDSRIIQDRILLHKDNGITINGSRLVFKGLRDNMIHLDVYLLELDPESAYPQTISKADAHKGIRVGDSTFQFLKVRRNTLQLKIIDLFRS